MKVVYRVSRIADSLGEIESINVLDETPKTYVFSGGRRELKTSQWHEFFETRDAAIRWIESRLLGKIRNAKQSMEYAKLRLDDFRDSVRREKRREK